jgi:hypothetical protein
MEAGDNVSVVNGEVSQEGNYWGLSSSKGPQNTNLIDFFLRVQVLQAEY